MLKKIIPVDRIEMLAERIEHAALFDMQMPCWCAYGHCLGLFCHTLPQEIDESNVDYLARVLGIKRKAAEALYYGYAEERAAYLGCRPIRTRADAAAVLRQLAAEKLAA